MFSRRRIRFALYALVALLGASALMGCNRRRHHDVDPAKAYKFVSWQVDDTLDELEANDKQRVEVHAIKDKVFDEAIALKDTSLAHRTVLHEQITGDAPDRQKMHAEVDAWLDEVRASAHVAVDASVDLHGVLTAEQRAKLVERLQEHMAD